MGIEHGVIKQIIEEIVHRYGVNYDEDIAEQYFYEALMDVGVQESIYDQVYRSIRSR